MGSRRTPPGAVAVLSIALGAWAPAGCARGPEPRPEPAVALEGDAIAAPAGTLVSPLAVSPQGTSSTPTTALPGTSTPRGAPAPEPTPAERALQEAPLAGLTLPPSTRGRGGRFEASLAVPGERGAAPAELTLMLDGAPGALHGSLAFYRLARALGAHGVAPVVLRRVPFGELGALLAGSAAAVALVRDHAVVGNDGTVEALLAAPSPEGASSPWRARALRPLAPLGSFEVEAWARWAALPDPAPGERPGLARGWVEMLVLDYLTGNVARRLVLVDDEAGSLVLPDNDGAFPLHIERSALDQLLRRLRAVARFPRGLREALGRLEPRAMDALLAPAGFETWLVAPRARLELEERRRGLLTLLEAKVEARGAEAVLCL